MKKCKSCHEKFTPIRSTLERYCQRDECIRVFVEEAKSKQWAKTKKAKKEQLMSLSDWLKIAQASFNSYIRERDYNEPCISCGKFINGVRHASHYLSSGGHSNVRFNEDNVWVSCYKCNVMLSGNQIEYRKRLIDKIGVDRVEWLEENGSKVKKWDIEELKEMIKKYKEKATILKNNR